MPTRGAAEELRRTFEDLGLLEGSDAALMLPDLVTRGELYASLHARLGDVPPLLTVFEREVLLRLAAEDAQREGAEAPFRLRPGLLAAILHFYDELRRRSRSLDTFDRTLHDRLSAGSDSDRGAARLLTQTRFLSATFAAFERRIGDSGAIDEHGLRTILLSTPPARPYRHIIICVPDQAASARGLWPADFDLLTRLPELQQLDIVATEALLAAGFHQRLHEALPGIEEETIASVAASPQLLAPAAAAQDDAPLHFVSRDREEELANVARWIKQRAQAASPDGRRALHRTAVVVQRPLPYLYLARHVFGSARVPYQAIDALPLAGESFAAAVDLIFAALSEEGSRTALVELLGSPQWSFHGATTPEEPVSRLQSAALDRVLRDAKYLGGWDRLRQLASTVDARTAVATRDAQRWRQAAPALSAAVAIAAELDAIGAAASASTQLEALSAFIARHEREPHAGDAGDERHMRARGAILGALGALADAHRRHDDRVLAPGDLIATLRRWMEDQTFAPRSGREGVLLIDAAAAAFANVEAVRLVGLVETDWPERGSTNIFYPASLLRDLGWPPDSERMTAARAQFQDLLRLARDEVSVSAFTLEDDAIVPPSPFLDDVGAAGAAGLVVHRAEPSTARVFAHEALAIAPIVPAAMSEPASGWLAMRLARTPSADARYRGTIGARRAETYAVSRVERFLACPFKYFAGHVLQLDEEREDESGLTPLERGQLLHGVFEAFFVEWRRRGGATITTDVLNDAVALFGEVAESSLQALPEADRALERTYLLGSAASPGLAERAFAFEIEHGVRVIERFVEYPFEGAFRFEGPDGERRITLRGKADRVDLLDDGSLRIVDYKLGRAPKPARALQLAVYAVCAAQQLDGHQGRTWSMGRAGYVAFREKNAFVELGGRGGNLDEALREGQHKFIDAIDRIEGGEFPPSPDEPWTCNRCGFSHVCRKDYVGDE